MTICKQYFLVDTYICNNYKVEKIKIKWTVLEIYDSIVIATHDNEIKAFQLGGIHLCW